MTYTVKGKYWITRNGVKQPAAPDMHFQTAMGMLRWALDNRMIRRAMWGNGTPGPKEMDRVSVPYAGSGDWEGDYYFSVDQVDAMRQALSRYRAILRYYREVEPDWQEVEGSRVHYADNSIEATEINKYGVTRRKIIDTPHGDVCF